MVINNLFAKKRNSDIEEIFNGLDMFDDMSVENLSSIIGIDDAELKKSIRKNDNSDKLNDTVKLLIDRINEIVDNDEFKNKVVSKIMFMKDYGTIIIENSELTGLFKTNNNDRNYVFKMNIRDNDIDFILSDNKQIKILTGNYIKRTTGDITINYSESNTNIVPLKEKTSYDVEILEKKLYFDKNGIQTYFDEYEQYSNYCLDDKTGKKTLQAPDMNKNYYKSSYIERNKQGFITKKVNKYYVYPEGIEEFIRNEDEFFIAKDNSSLKEIPKNIDYTKIDNYLYNKYINGEYPIEKVWENKNENYCYSSSVR